MPVQARLVESVIAASIIIVAAEIFYPLLRAKVGLVVFLFGLFHGAGFASVLLSMDIHSDYLFLTLLGFNVGVEFGQMGIVALAVPLLFLIRTQPIYLRFGMQFGGFALIAIGSYWFVERALGIDLPAGEYAKRVLAFLS